MKEIYNNKDNRYLTNFELGELIIDRLKIGDLSIEINYNRLCSSINILRLQWTEDAIKNKEKLDFPTEYTIRF